MPVERFGTVDGTDVFELSLRTGAGAEARILTWGAVIRDLIVPAPRGRQRVVLGLNQIEDYVAHSPYFGAIVGRYANRIADAALALDGVTHPLHPIDARVPPLHRGAPGIGCSG